MNRPSLILAFSLALTLAACGGGGGGGGFVPTGGGSPTPAPTPTSTSTPIGSDSCVQSNSGAPVGWGASSVKSALNFPFSLSGTTYNGAGQTVAVVIDSNINPGDVTAYLASNGVTQTGKITDEPVDGSDTGCHSGEQDEATLDVETIAGLAPAANIIIYQLPYNSSGITDQSLADAYNKIISDGKAFVVNTSLGGCEGGPGNPPEHTVMATGAGKGILFVSSAGDSGNLCQTGPNTVGASYPASDPYGIGAGGTETNISNRDTLTSNVEWNDASCQGGICAGGGGISTLFTIPSYQTASLLTNCRTPAHGAACSLSMRNTPDISMPAEDVNVYEGGWWQAEGTSWSSPEFAALIADVYEYCNRTNGISNPATIPYYVYNTASSDFIDVNSGDDQIAKAPLSPFYAAGTGYDDSNGLGVPNSGAAFAQTACPNHVPASGLIATGHQTAALAMQPAASALDVTPRVAGLVDRGERASNETTRIQLVLRPEFASAGTEAQVVSALQRAGLNVVQRFPNHLVIDAEGPSASVERLFETQMHDVSQGGYGVRYLPVRPATIPASVAPYVATVSLDNVVTRHKLTHRAFPLALMP